MVNIDFTKEPKEVVDYLAKKGLKTTFDYKEMMYEAHHASFTVAKMTNLDLLGDVHQSLQSAFKEGKPFKQWKDEITPTLQKYGWLGKTDVINPDTGEVKTINVNSRRLKHIYNTNMRVAYAQARYKNQMQGDSEYWRYVSLLKENTHLSHRAMHGIILHRSHPFWKKNYPPNDHVCYCKVSAYTKESIEANEWKVSEGEFADVAGKDWAYNVGDSGYALERVYFKKVKAFTCKESNAKIRTVLCPFVEAVKSGYLADMLSLLPKKKEWDSFVDRALDTTIKNHEEMRLGYLSAITGLETYLKENPPKSDLILADTGSIRNLKARGEDSVAKTKKEATRPKNTLTTDDLKKLIEVIHAPTEIYKDDFLLLVYDFDEGKNKIALSIDTGDKNRVYHTIKSGQKYTKEEFESFLNDGRKIKKIEEK